LLRGTRSLEVLPAHSNYHIAEQRFCKQEGTVTEMKIVANPKPSPAEDIPVVDATPIASVREEISRARMAPERATVSGGDAAAISFLRQFRVLVGAARLYHRNHPRLMEILASAEQQLRVVLALQSPLVFAVERNGILLPRYDAKAGELLNDPRGELRSLAEELLRSGICSLSFTPQTNVGELDLFVHEMSRVPRSATPGDTSSRMVWEKWLREHRVIGIRLNVPTERRDSLLLASLVSAVLAYDETPQRSLHSRAKSAQPVANFEQMSAALRILTKLAPPRDLDTETSPEDVGRRTHSVLLGGDRLAVSLAVYGVSNVKPREGETLEPYLGRLADALMLGFLKQEFEAGRTTALELTRLVVRLDQVRNESINAGAIRFGAAQYDEARVAALCERFWNTLPARVKAKALRGSHAWCVPSAVVAKFLEPLALAAEKKKSEAAGREGRAVLLAFTRSLESEEGKVRRTVASGLAELAPQIERLWPHPSIADFGKGVVQALLVETSPGVAGLLSAVVESLARVSLIKHEYAEFERILETLELSPRDDEHAHISTLVGRILNDEQWLYLVEEALANRPLNPVVPRLLRRCPDRLVDRLGLLLTASSGIDSLPAMVRLIHAVGEPVLGVLESRLYEPRRQRIATAIYLLASSDPKRLAAALPRALPSWEWSLQDLAVSELARWTNPPVVSASAKAFLALLVEAHAMVVPGMIDHLGSANETSAIPLLLKVAAGECLGLRDIYFRIKAVEALGKMRVVEAAPLLLRIVRERNGLAHSEPAALRSVAEEALALLEGRQSSARTPTAEKALSKSGKAHARPRRYVRAHLQTPLPATIVGTHSSAVRVRTISLGGAFLESDRRIAVGESLRVEMRSGLRRLQFTAVVRNVSPSGTGVEFVHMKSEDRERLRRLVAQALA
jgi:PilZ domain